MMMMMMDRPHTHLQVRGQELGPLNVEAHALADLLHAVLHVRLQRAPLQLRAGPVLLHQPWCVDGGGGGG